MHSESVPVEQAQEQTGTMVFLEIFFISRKTRTGFSPQSPQMINYVHAGLEERMSSSTGGVRAH